MSSNRIVRVKVRVKDLIEAIKKRRDRERKEYERQITEAKKNVETYRKEYLAAIDAFRKKVEKYDLERDIEERGYVRLSIIEPHQPKPCPKFDEAAWDKVLKPLEITSEEELMISTDDYYRWI